MKKIRNAGFSLVELIVVIAIMAILVGVAVPVYTSYIEKAQKSKDEQLVDEIVHAMEIAAIGENWYEKMPGGGVVGTVVISKDGTTVQDADTTNKLIANAMGSTFGTNYSTEMTLSYDGWTGTLTTDIASLILNSSYAMGDTPSAAVTDLLGTVQDVTTLFADVVGALGNVGGLNEDTTTYLKDLYGLDDSTNLSNQQIANGMVMYIAELQLKSGFDYDKFYSGWSSEPNFTDCAVVAGQSDDFGALAAEYAYVQAFVSRTRCPELKASFDNYNTSFDGASPYTSIWQAHLKTNCSTCTSVKDNMSSEDYAQDAVAYLALMTQVVDAKNVVVENGDSKTLYTDSPLVQYVSSYLSVAELLTNTENIAEDGDVILVFYMDTNGGISADIYPLTF